MGDEASDLSPRPHLPRSPISLYVVLCRAWSCAFRCRGDRLLFGQVLEGMDVVDKIAAAETDDNDKPKKDIKIEKIEIIKDYDFSK